MKALLQKLSFRLLACWWVVLGFARLGVQENERVYSLSEVAAIDRENKLWRLVDPREEVEANVKRLGAAGVPLAEVEKFKPRLIEFWGEIDPAMQVDWLDQKTRVRIRELKSKYQIPMRRARVDEALCRLGGDEEGRMPYEIEGRLREAICQMVTFDEWAEFQLMNSTRSRELCRLTKNLPTTASERLALCRLQHDYYTNRWFPGDGASHDEEVLLRPRKALLNYWQQMRDLLGDKRFAAYLESADAGFGQMSFVLTQMAGVSCTKILDLWWTRKKDELDDARKPGKISWRQRKMEIYDSAGEMLGAEALQIYLKDDDGKWLKEGAPWRMPPMKLASSMAEIETADVNFRRHQ